MQSNFNNELLLLARQYRGLSQASVAERSGLDQGHYSRIERGLLNTAPSENSIRSIAKGLDFPQSFFLQNDELSGLPLSIHDASWRKKASMTASGLKRLHAELNLRIMHIRRYLSAVEVDEEIPLPSFDVDEVGGADNVAKLLRRTWMISPGPIKNLTNLCERAGILVVHCPFDEKIDGVTMRLRDIPPLIFLNSNAPADRMRHSLAHELGHLIMHSVPTDNMENEADEFAGEFLTPLSELRSDLIGGKVTLQRLAQLKKYRRVSMASLLYRAGKHGIITSNQAGYLWRQLSARGWKKREPQETQFEKEKTPLYNHILSIHENDLDYDVFDFSKMLHISTNEVRKLYGVLNNGNRNRISLVK